jgi:hypothetical protein
VVAPLSTNFHLSNYLPNLEAGFLETSPQSDLYNCIAWAAGDSARWWWPDEDSYWPSGAPRVYEISAFLAAYQTLGYVECEDADLEAGFEKIAIYADTKGPQHAARQLGDGKWTSKLGPYEDISHIHVSCVNCPLYGVAVKFMKRVRQS